MAVIHEGEVPAGWLWTLPRGNVTRFSATPTGIAGEKAVYYGTPREVRTVLDPFTGKQVEISNRLVDRLRGRYASGPTMPNGEPEFGWRYHDTPPIQKEAAAELERLLDIIKQMGGTVE